MFIDYAESNNSKFNFSGISQDKILKQRCNGCRYEHLVVLRTEFIYQKF